LSKIVHDFYPIRLINFTLDGHSYDGIIYFITVEFSVEFPFHDVL